MPFVTVGPENSAAIKIYYRRGFGAPSRPSTGYDFDTLAADLHALLSRLGLRGVVLAGFAMGTGEVTRYLAVHGSGRVKAAVLVAPLLPFLLKTHDSPDGIDRSVFDRVTACLEDFRADLATISIPHCSTSSATRTRPGSAVSLRIPAITFQTQTQTVRRYRHWTSAASWGRLRTCRAKG